MKRDVRREAVAFTKQIFDGFGEPATVVQEMICGCCEYGDGDGTTPEKLKEMKESATCIGWSGGTRSQSEIEERIIGVAMLEAIRTGSTWIDAAEWLAEQAANGFIQDDIRLIQMEHDIPTDWEVCPHCVLVCSHGTPKESPCEQCTVEDEAADEKEERFEKEKYANANKLTTIEAIEAHKFYGNHYDDFPAFGMIDKFIKNEETPMLHRIRALDHMGRNGMGIDDDKLDENDVRRYIEGADL